MDAACREHNIAYSQSKELNKRHQADKILAERAWQRVTSKDSDLKERAAAWFVTNAMKTKVNFGLGIPEIKSKSKKLKKKKQGKKKRKTSGKKLFKEVINKTKKLLKSEKPKDIENAVKIAQSAIHADLKRKKSKISIPRIIPLPKIGGFLPLIPIITALAALGTTGSSIYKTIRDIKQGKEDLEESKRHNRYMESIAMGKGLFLKPYKKGYGLFYGPQASQSKNF